MKMKVSVDVPEYNRFTFDVEGDTIEEIKAKALNQVHSEESNDVDYGVDSIEAPMRVMVHEEEKFFHKPKETDKFLGAYEPYAVVLCAVCCPEDWEERSDFKELTKGMLPIICNGCGKEICDTI